MLSLQNINRLSVFTLEVGACLPADRLFLEKRNLPFRRKVSCKNLRLFCESTTGLFVCLFILAKQKDGTMSQIRCLHFVTLYCSFISAYFHFLPVKNPFHAHSLPIVYITKYIFIKK